MHEPATIPPVPDRGDDYLAANDASRDRLHALTARLTTQELARRVSGDWTVAASLAHLAFWDRATLIRWQRHRAGVPLVSVPDDLTDVLNDAGLKQWQALNPDAVTRDVVAIAEELDAEIASLPPELVANATERFPRLLDRSAHRLEHIVEIDRTLTKK